VNVSMWVKALRVMPRMDKNEWDRLDIIAKWLVATRSAALVLSFMASLIAGLLAFRDGEFNGLRWIVLTIGLVFAHGTNNLLNDLVDYQKGVDKGNYFRAQYGPQPLETGFMTIRKLLAYAAVTGAVAVACGLYLVSVTGTGTIVLMAIGAFLVLFYTYPLKYIGLGELSVLAVWGPLMIVGGYYVMSGQWSWNLVLASLPFGLGVSAALFGKHIDKYAPDKEKRIHTLPVLLGERNARYAALAMMVLQYVIVVVLVLTRYFTPAMLLVVFALPSLNNCFKMFRYPRPAEKPDFYPADAWPLWFVASSFVHSRDFGSYFVLGLIIDAALRVSGILA
jgi:1,4-dihydroxy-2-naphthoate polyprenyltransferase